MPTELHNWKLNVLNGDEKYINENLCRTHLNLENIPVE